jgi:hypothetical protein
LIIARDIASLISYYFDESNRITIEFGFKDTASEGDKWFEYEFLGNEVLKPRVTDEMRTDTY